MISESDIGLKSVREIIQVKKPVDHVRSIKKFLEDQPKSLVLPWNESFRIFIVSAIFSKTKSNFLQTVRENEPVNLQLKVLIWSANMRPKIRGGLWDTNPYCEVIPFHHFWTGMECADLPIGNAECVKERAAWWVRAGYGSIAEWRWIRLRWRQWREICLGSFRSVAQRQQQSLPCRSPRLGQVHPGSLQYERALCEWVEAHPKSRSCWNVEAVSVEETRPLCTPDLTLAPFHHVALLLLSS